MIALVCIHCNHSNLSDAKFCSGCGAGLLRRLCPRCHVANGLDAHFCLDCGTKLPEPELRPTQPQAEVQMPSIAWKDAQQPYIAMVPQAQPQALVTVPGASGMVVAEEAPGRRASVTAARGAIVAAVLLALGTTLWVFMAPGPGASASAPQPGALSVQAGAGSVNASRAAPPEPPAPVVTQAAATAAATAAAIGNVATAAAIPSVGKAGAGQAGTVASGREAAPQLPKPLRRERGTASRAEPAPPVAARRVPAIACTPNAQALGLCDLTP